VLENCTAKRKVKSAMPGTETKESWSQSREVCESGSQSSRESDSHFTPPIVATTFG